MNLSVRAANAAFSRSIPYHKKLVSFFVPFQSYLKMTSPARLEINSFREIQEEPAYTVEIKRTLEIEVPLIAVSRIICILHMLLLLRTTKTLCISSGIKHPTTT